MSEPIHDPIDQVMDQDREALRSATTNHTHGLAETSRFLAEAYSNSKGIQNMQRQSKSRWVPRAVLAGGVALLVGFLLVVPLPYDVTVGHQIDLTVSGKLDPAIAKRLTHEIQLATGAKTVELVADADGAAQTMRFRVPTRTRSRADRIAAAVVKSLAARSIEATAQVEPVVESTSGSVYAMAMDKWLSVDVDTAGKSDDEIADDIYAQLLAGGVQDAEVSVETGEDSRTVRIGGKLDGRQFQLVQERVGDHGDEPVRVEMQPIDAERDEGMTDEQLIEKIRAQLAERGLDGDVSIDAEGHIRIEARREICEGEGCP